MHSQAALVNLMIKQKRIHQYNKSAIKALQETDRSLYCNPKFCTRVEDCYEDSPQIIHSDGVNSVTISAPHIHFLMINELSSMIKTGTEFVLDIGSGSGFLTAVFGRLLREAFKNQTSKNKEKEISHSHGKVIGVERISELVEASIQSIMSDDKTLIEENYLEIISGDGWLGDNMDTKTKYTIICSGAASKAVPLKLIDQLAKPGMLILPVEDNYNDQDLVKFTKNLQGNVKKEVLFPVKFVPLNKPRSNALNFFASFSITNF